MQSSIIQSYLKGQEYQVMTASTGQAALEQVSQADLVILDVILPDMSGYEILSFIRENQLRARVIMLSTLADTSFKVRGLKSGADDYLGKPFDLTELEARIQALLRQNFNPLEATTGRLRISKVDQCVYIQQKKVELSKQETELLWYMAEHPEQPHSRQELLDNVWGADFQGGERIIDVMMVSLRKKLGNKVIQTVRGVGYQLHPEEAGK
ncbi:DNA-binding response regulator [Deinococcus cellulosilyticus NBRC 106333 = KACC 11606]|uniref:DNA-binding response regulator n=1 Tax=Deinococcus cellulosilyticus (strain DSM 18568 / NBRC 106333 / KACC 11606 / 5516J-15) TaxID=1223518 RepID=A0A511N9A1_DEIC1|nr:DNA-binding response regulator [Deinococcus cellulosilyticus NBRC 106333 = KACC 11606]